MRLMVPQGWLSPFGEGAPFPTAPGPIEGCPAVVVVPLGLCAPLIHVPEIQQHFGPGSLNRGGQIIAATTAIRRVTDGNHFGIAPTAGPRFEQGRPVIGILRDLSVVAILQGEPHRDRLTISAGRPLDSNVDPLGGVEVLVGPPDKLPRCLKIGEQVLCRARGAAPGEVHGVDEAGIAVDRHGDQLIPRQGLGWRPEAQVHPVRGATHLLGCCPALNGDRIGNRAQIAGVLAIRCPHPVGMGAPGSKVRVGVVDGGGRCARHGADR